MFQAKAHLLQAKALLRQPAWSSGGDNSALDDDAPLVSEEEERRRAVSEEVQSVLSRWWSVACTWHNSANDEGLRYARGVVS